MRHRRRLGRPPTGALPGLLTASRTMPSPRFSGAIRSPGRLFGSAAIGIVAARVWRGLEGPPMREPLQDDPALLSWLSDLDTLALRRSLQYTSWVDRLDDRPLVSGNCLGEGRCQSPVESSRWRAVRWCVYRSDLEQTAEPTGFSLVDGFVRSMSVGRRSLLWSSLDAAPRYNRCPIEAETPMVDRLPRPRNRDLGQGWPAALAWAWASATKPGAAVNDRRSVPSSRFQSRTSPSQLPEASVCPSGERARV